MTDLCMDPTAESRAVSAVSSASFHDDGTLPDALQSLANLKLSQQKGLEAAEAMGEVWKHIGPGCSAMAKAVGMGDKDVRENIGEDTVEQSAMEVWEDELKAVNELPGFEFRYVEERND